MEQREQVEAVLSAQWLLPTHLYILYFTILSFLTSLEIRIQGQNHLKFAIFWSIVSFFSIYLSWIFEIYYFRGVIFCTLSKFTSIFKVYNILGEKLKDLPTNTIV